MRYTEIELLAGLRMLFSGDQLLSLRKVDKLKDEELLAEGTKVLDLPSELIDDAAKIKSFIDSSISANGIPNYVSISGNVFAIAECAADVDNVLADRGVIYKDLLPGRMQNKVVIITGGAQGFGAGLAESFFNEGANLVIADMNVKVGEACVSDFNSRNTPNKALFVECDVSEFQSVQDLIDSTVLHFGGVDVMISNAGILRAGGLDEMTPESFELMTKVNYTGYFNCAKAAASIMKVQYEFSEKRHFDILQVNSKSGLRGSNKNFAYAGGKFGGIGLTQSFALELMPFRIKVNSICPGNFFDGPLWSDPEKGLFVQYLKAGKIPGAKTVEDVKAFYEKQVPAGRGCETGDVAKAAFYAIEQEYETGQAIPVTGGQVMLN